MKSPLDPSQRHLQMRAKLDGRWVLPVRHPNPQEIDGAVRLVIELGKLNTTEAAKAILLGELISQPFFYELRTVQQLGYIVESAISEDRGITYLICTVQSAVPPEEVTRRLHAFLDTVHFRIANTTSTTFSEVVRAAVAQLLETPKSLSQVADDAWAEIVEQTNRFNRNQEVAAALRITSLQSVVDLWDRCGADGPISRPSRLLVQVYGTRHSIPELSGMPKGYSVLKSVKEFRAGAVYW